MVESDSPRVLIIIPAYNEAQSIPRVLDDLREHVPEADAVVVDDGSTDETASVAGRLGAAVLRLPCNLGVGGAMRTGYRYALENGYGLAVQFDGDGQHRADQIRPLLALVIEDGVDLAIGSRLLGSGSYRFSRTRWIGSRLIAAIASLVARWRVTDPTSGFRASSKQMIAFFAKYYPQTYLGDTVEAMVLAARHGMKVRETQTEMRQSARSSIGNIKGVFHTVCICLAILVDCIESKFPDYAQGPAPGKENPS